jgi:hypothetical protein
VFSSLGSISGDFAMCFYSSVIHYFYIFLDLLDFLLDCCYCDIILVHFVFML